jgi:hypothetical protein
LLRDGTGGWLWRNLAYAEGVWRGMLLDRDGELDLSAIGPQNEGGFSFTVLGFYKPKAAILLESGDFT